MDDVRFQSEIQATLTGVVAGMLATSAAHGSTNREYVRGVADLAHAVALAFGLPWQRVGGDLPASCAHPRTAFDTRQEHREC